MFTVCSKCNLRLTVTATDLRAAQGYVRCGRCHNVFNALAALADDPTREGQAEGTASATQSRPVLTLPEPPPPVPATAPRADDPSSTDTSLEFNPASTNINEVFIEAAASERTGTFEAIILSGEDPADPELPAPQEEEPAIAPQALSAPAVPAPPDDSAAVDVRRLRDVLAAPAPAPPEQLQTAIPVTPDPAPPAAVPDDEIPYMTTWSTAPHADEGFVPAAVAAAVATPAAEQAAAPAAELDPVPAPTRMPRWALQAAAAALLLCLLAQLLHHYREPLADVPLLHRPISALYSALGLPLEPRWEVGRYEIRQLGLTADGAPTGQLVVRASISNRATRDQPLPLLRVVMQDQFGNRVAARDLTPAEYLGRGAPQVSLMAPSQRVDVQVAFQDPGKAATGFEIDACMASQTSRIITCANDPVGH